MMIFLRYIIRCMTEKKSRFILLVSSIALSTMLLVASLGVVELITSAYTNAYTTGYESKQVSISSGETQFFKLEDLEEDGIKELDGELVCTAVLKHDNDEDEIIYVTLRGKQTDVIELNYEEFVLEGDTKGLKEDECIISKRISDERNIAKGDLINVTLFDETLNLKVAGICSETGLFYVDQSNQFSMIVSHECLAEFFDIEDEYNNVVFAKAEDVTIMESVKRFNDANKDEGFVAEAMYAEEVINDQYQSFMISMYAMMIIVILTCFVIILGAFSLVINERLSTIGTFLSVGSTTFRIKFLLLVESILYGVLGGVIGDVVAVVVLRIINQKISPFAKYGVVEDFEMNVSYLLIGFIFAILLSFVSACIPVKKINKLPIKDVILNSFFVPVKVGWTNFIIGAVMLIVSIVATIANKQWTYDCAPIFAVTGVLGIVLIATKVIEQLSKMIGNIAKNGASIFYLAVNNLRTSRVLLSNSILIIVTLISSISIGAVSDSIITGLSAGFTEFSYDVTISNIHNSSESMDDDAIIEDLKNMEIVDESSINPFYDVQGTLDDKFSVKVLGVEPKSYVDYMEYLRLDSEENKSVYQDFEKASNNVVLVSEKVLKTLDKKLHDTIAIKVGDKTKDFEIIGSIDGRMFCSGAFILVRFDDMRELYDLGEPSKITLKFKENDTTSCKKLKREVVDYGATVSTKEEDKQRTINTMSSLCNSLTIFSKIVIVISIFGIINNMLVGLFQRKKELALLLSVGMNKAKKNKMLFLESLISFIFSIMIIVPYSFLLIRLANNFMSWTGLAVDVKLDVYDMFISIGIAFVSVLFASIPVLVKSSKISVMNELRYE